MTSRDVSERRCPDQLDVMIRWTLRESVAGATPPTDGWERIKERLSQQPGKPGAAWWRGLRVACASAGIWLLESAVGPPTQLVYCGGAGLVDVREKYDLRLLMYQQATPMLLGQVL